MILKRATCLVCMASFDRSNARHRFCSKECREKNSIHEKLTLNCRNCGNSFLGFKGRVYCSKQCSKPLQVIAPSLLPTSTRGTIGELIVATDLLKKEYYVFRSVTPNSPFDLIAYRANKVLRIEVTSGTKIGTRLDYPPHNKHIGKFDTLAVVMPDYSIEYVPPLEV